MELVDVTLAGEVFCLAVDKHVTCEELAGDAYREYCACFPENLPTTNKQPLMVKDSRGRIINGCLRVLELSTERTFEVIMGAPKTAPTKRDRTTTNRSSRDPEGTGAYHSMGLDSPDESSQDALGDDLVEVKIHEETFLIALDKDTTVASMAGKAYEEYRLSYPAAVMKRVVLVRDNAGRVCQGNLKVHRLPGGGKCIYEVVIDEQPWTEEVLPVEAIEATYRNWQLTTARSVASLVYQVCTTEASASFAPAPATAFGASSSGLPAPNQSPPAHPPAYPPADDPIHTIRTALTLIQELNHSSSLPVQLSCMEALRLVLMMHDDLDIVDGAFALVRRAFTDAVRVETAVAALRTLRDAIETTAIVLSKETIASLNIDVARSKVAPTICYGVWCVVG